MNRSNIIKKITVFLGLTFLISWSLWLPTVLYGQGILVPIPLLMMGMFASFVPSVIGIFGMRATYGKAWFNTYLKPRLSYKFRSRWLWMIPVFFLSQGALSFALVKILDQGFNGGSVVQFASVPVIFLQILLFGGALGEEFGWRGYLYPLLKQLGSPLKMTLVLGLVWSIWHLPLFFMIGTVQSSMPIWQFLFQNTLMAFFYTWIYERTEGNLILMVYLHAVANTTSAIFPYWQSNMGRLTGFGILLVFAILIFMGDRKVSWK